MLANLQIYTVPYANDTLHSISTSCDNKNNILHTSMPRNRPRTLTKVDEIYDRFLSLDVGGAALVIQYQEGVH